MDVAARASSAIVFDFVMKLTTSCQEDLLDRSIVVAVQRSKKARLHAGTKVHEGTNTPLAESERAGTKWEVHI